MSPLLYFFEACIYLCIFILVQEESLSYEIDYLFFFYLAWLDYGYFVVIADREVILAFQIGY
jgi:hypothetical protein